MTEPIYEYVKGKGWVIPEPNTVTMRCGTRVRLEFRKPKTGEIASYNVMKYTTFSWEKWAQNNRFRDIQARREDVFPDFDWCVVVPV